MTQSSNDTILSQIKFLKIYFYLKTIQGMFTKTSSRYLQDDIDSVMPVFETRE